MHRRLSSVSLSFTPLKHFVELFLLFMFLHSYHVFTLYLKLQRFLNEPHSFIFSLSFIGLLGCVNTLRTTTSYLEPNYMNMRAE